MTSISPAILFSRATFIPWMGTEAGDLPGARGLHWGIRMPYPTAVMMTEIGTIGPQPEKKSELEQKRAEAEVKQIEPISKIEPKPEKEKP